MKKFIYTLLVPILSALALGSCESIVYDDEYSKDGFYHGNTAVCSVLDFEQRHVIVARHRHFFPFQGQHFGKIFRVVDGSAFHDIERIGKTVVAAEVLHQSFESNPVFLIELLHLRSHVAHVERLFVGL